MRWGAVCYAIGRYVLCGGRCVLRHEVCVVQDGPDSRRSPMIDGNARSRRGNPRRLLIARLPPCQSTPHSGASIARRRSTSPSRSRGIRSTSHRRKLGKRLASSQPSRDVENAPGRPPAAPSGRIAPSVEHARQAIGGRDALGLQGVDRRRQTRRPLVCFGFERLHGESVETLSL